MSVTPAPWWENPELRRLYDAAISWPGARLVSDCSRCGRSGYGRRAGERCCTWWGGYRGRHRKTPRS